MTTISTGSGAPVLNGTTRRDLLRGAGLGVAEAALGAAPAAASGARNRRGTPIGCAVQRRFLDADADYRAAIRRYCDLVVTEDALKWDHVHPAPDRFDFVEADAIVAFAHESGLGIRGHALVYHGQMPAWTEAIATRREAEAAMRLHIDAVVGRYRGIIGSYDVVNEFTDDRPEVGSGLRPTLWMRLIGPDYIDMALRLATAADPAARLVLSDYFLENEGPHYDARRAVMLGTVRHLVARGVPIHGVGIQGHMYADRRVDRSALARFTADLRELGVGVLVTEFDMIDQMSPADVTQRDAVAAAYAFELLDAIGEGGGVEACLTWGIADKYSWITEHKPRPDGLPTRPLPLDEQYRPKPLCDVLQHWRRWITPQAIAPAGRTIR